MVAKGKKRVVIIYHPDFQIPGATGIQEARNVGDQFLMTIKAKEMMDLVPEAKRAELEAHLQKFKVYVTKVDGGTLK